MSHFYSCIFYCLHAGTHGRQSSRLQWGSTRTQWTPMWLGSTFWSVTLTKADACTATGSSAPSGPSQPSSGRLVFTRSNRKQLIVLTSIYLTVFVRFFLDPGDQSDGDIREGTLYSWPGGEKDGVVLNKCKHISMLGLMQYWVDFSHGHHADRTFFPPEELICLSDYSHQLDFSGWEACLQTTLWQPWGVSTVASLLSPLKLSTMTVG